MSEQVLKFWMVLKDGCTYTSFRHNNNKSACSEAKRLALENPGYKFFVLEVTNAFIDPKKEPRELTIIENDIPF